MLLSVVSRGAAAIVNSDTPGTQTSPAVAMDANGDSIVVWKDARLETMSGGYMSDIRAQRYSPSGAPVHMDGTTAGTQEFQVNAAVDAKFIERDAPAVAMDANGDFVVAWQRNDTTTTGNYIYEIQARVFNAAGTPLTGDITVSANNHDARNEPALAMDSSGNWVITWTDQDSGTSQINADDILARKYSLSGTQLALNGSLNALQVNTGAAATGNQFEPSVAADAAGDFLVSWTSIADLTNDPSNSELFAQRFNPSGVAQGSLIHVNTTTAAGQSNSKVAMTSAGDFIITWFNDLNDGSPSRGDIFYKRYNADGSLRNNPGNVDLQANASSANDQQSPSVDIDANGNAAISWNTVSLTNGSNLGLFFRRINAQGQPIEGSDIPISTISGANQDSTGVAVDAQGDVAAIYRQQTGTGPSTNLDIFAQFFKYVNDAPTLTQPGNLTINENASQQTVNLAGITAGGPAGASNPESQTLAVAASSNNTGLIPNPTVTYASPGATGTLTFTPAAGQSGTATITVTLTDNGGTANGGSNQVVKTFTVTVVGAPIADNQSASVAHDTAKAITLTGSDPNVPPHSLTYIVLTSPAHGMLAGTAPNLTYTPNAGYQGTDSFTFKDNNGTSDSNVATVSLTVAAATPTANNQTVAVSHNTAKSITLTGTDGNDNPALPLTFGVATNPSHGTLSGFNAATGAVTYTPVAGYQGTDSFTFTTANGQKTSGAATVTLTVAAGTPTANPQSVTTPVNTAKAITLTGSDPDVPALPLTFAVATNPSHGTLSGFNAATGAVTYTPAAGYHGPDSFTFTDSNGTNTSSAATVTIDVQSGTPTANPQTVTVAHNTATAVVLTGSDPNNLALTFSVATSPTHGSLSGTAPNLTYTPSAGFHGTDSFTFTDSNGTNTSSPATVTLNVGVGTPTASPQSVNVVHNSSGAAITLTATDDDTPALPQTFAVVAGQGPSHGTLSGFNAATGAVTYTPAAGYHGTDSFRFTSSNGTNTSSAATVTLTVAAGTPTANPQAVSTNQDTPLSITLTGTDDDSPALPLTFAIVGGQGPSHGTVSGFNAATGAVTYTPNAGYSGGDSFQFTVSNGTNTSTAASITITVSSTQAAPSITTSPSNQSVIAGQTATFTAAATGSPTPTVQWQVSIDGGSHYTDISGATSTTLSFPASLAQNGDLFRAVFTNTGGSTPTNAATLTVAQATIASTVGVAWGTAATATLQTNADGLRLLPDGRNTDLPWLGINRITITLNAPEALSPGDVSVTGINVANYGPVLISGSGTTYTITLNQPINAADRVTVTIGNADIATFTRRLDVLPGDVNDDGVVNSQDAVIVRNAYLAIAPVTIPLVFLDINGDGVVDVNDYGLVHNRAATHLP